VGTYLAGVGRLLPFCGVPGQSGLPGVSFAPGWQHSASESELQTFERALSQMARPAYVPTTPLLAAFARWRLLLLKLMHEIKACSKTLAARLPHIKWKPRARTVGNNCCRKKA